MAAADTTLANTIKEEQPTEEILKAAPSVAEGAVRKDGLTEAIAQSDTPAQTTAAASSSAVPSAEAAKPIGCAGPITDAEMTDAPGEAAVPSGDVPAVSAPAIEPAAEEPDIKIDPVTIGFRTFASGSECYEYFRSLLSQLSHDQDLNEYEFTMVMDLLRKGHADPEGKIGSGVKAIQVKPHESLDSVCFFVHRTDGSKEDFSYRKCLLRLFKDLKELSQVQDPPVFSSRGRGRGRNSSGRGARGRGGGR